MFRILTSEKTNVTIYHHYKESWLKDLLRFETDFHLNYDHAVMVICTFILSVLGGVFSAVVVH